MPASTFTDVAPTRSFPGRLAAWLAFALAFAALGYTARFAGGEEPKDVAYRYSSSIAALFQYALILGILLLIAHGLSKREMFALRRPESWPRAIGYTALALLAIWGSAAVLSPVLRGGTHEQGLVPTAWEPAHIGAFIAFFAAVTVLAPVVEELTYRGLGFTLLRPYGRWTAIVTTGVLFGLAHGLVIALPVLVIFGIAVAWVRDKTGSVYPGMILHSTFNGVALIAAVLVAHPSI
jgi:membrane protease YdiL (CAAX protease family)